MYGGVSTPDDKRDGTVCLRARRSSYPKYVLLARRIKYVEPWKYWYFSLLVLRSSRRLGPNGPRLPIHRSSPVGMDSVGRPSWIPYRSSELCERPRAGASLLEISTGRRHRATLCSAGKPSKSMLARWSADGLPELLQSKQAFGPRRNGMFVAAER